MRKNRNGNRSPSALPLLLVEWEDSAQPESPWQWVHDYKIPKIVACVSVGYLIAETKNAIAIAPNLGDVSEPRAQACGIMRIPRRAIIRQRRLAVI